MLSGKDRRSSTSEAEERTNEAETTHSATSIALPSTNSGSSAPPLPTMMAVFGDVVVVSVETVVPARTTVGVVAGVLTNAVLIVFAGVSCAATGSDVNEGPINVRPITATGMLERTNNN